jgi:hydroxymethylpyrimidine pyrophosphatase-like HAD family hydrolase
MSKNLKKKDDIRLLSFDIDNTLIDLHTLKGKFNKVWNTYKHHTQVLLTYNTGRLIDDTLHLIEKNIIPEPDYIISGVGTHIYDFKNQCVVKEFNDVLDDGWDLEAVESIIQSIDHPISEQPIKFQHSYKRSYYFHDATTELIAKIEQDFANANMHVNVVYSGDMYLDILPTDCLHL